MMRAIYKGGFYSVGGTLYEVEILKEGSAYAEKTAAATLDEVRKAMRIDYFENNNLLK